VNRAVEADAAANNVKRTVVLECGSTSPITLHDRELEEVNTSRPRGKGDYRCFFMIFGCFGM
jgi:hypothetical protein